MDHSSEWCNPAENSSVNRVNTFEIFYYQTKKIIKMKITKSLFLSAFMIGLFSFSSYAGDPVPKKDNSKVSTQIQKLLTGLDITSMANEETLKIDFMVNPKGEIIVISTNNESMDSSLKHKLNYKKLNSKNLETFKTYTVPVKIKK